MVWGYAYVIIGEADDKKMCTAPQTILYLNKMQNY